MAFFAEKDGFSHLHIHVVPRMPDLREDITGPRVFEYLRQQPSEWVPEDEQDGIAARVASLLDRVRD